MGVILYGGLFTILFGVIFGSFFGVALPFQILPSPVPDNTDREMSTANMMLILLFCLGLGVLHIMAGYLMKAFNSFRKGKIADGIFDALTWVLFFIGMIFAVFSFLMDYFKIYQNSSVVFSDGLKRFFQIMQLPGIIMLVAALLLAMVTAGRKERGFGKFSKGFGALYGVINLMSALRIAAFGDDRREYFQRHGGRSHRRRRIRLCVRSARHSDRSGIQSGDGGVGRVYS